MVAMSAAVMMFFITASGHIVFDDFVYIMPIAIGGSGVGEHLIFAAILPIAIFSFATSKRASTLFFGLPIKRSSLFLGRFAVGLSLLMLHLLLLAAFTFVSVAWANGITLYFVQGFLMVFGSLAAAFFLMYAVTVLVCMCLYTFVERVVCVFILVYLFQLVPVVVQRLVTPFSHLRLTEGFMRSFPGFSPGMGIYAIMGRYGVVDNVPDAFSLPFWDDGQSAGWGIILVWLVVGIAASYFALFAFKKYKTEQVGVFGHSIGLNVGIVSVLIFILSSGAILEMDIFETRPFAAVIVIILMCLCLLLLARFGFVKFREYYLSGRGL
jgi:hypothetical protein